ncbi:LPS-assembly protein LptD [Candidatus Nitrotoga arctica]|uniref:LPS-assembly protein LptD n=1 Tax=Candidatus Nitrotoga arctica TaxID=453162 RepID=A0ABM8YVD9_9PROT|nr:LPS-assembly protein LptD [Candidatus Nitrotoga arctica]CAG9931418.1 LPS-assembly protein LptD [Candidatus Nitrotoga arctica]
MHFRLNLVAFSLLYAFMPVVYAEGEVLLLKLDRTFMNLPKGDEETPAFISAQRVEGQTENQIVASGEVEVRKRGQAIFADRVIYQQLSKELVADGAVRVEQNGIKMQGPHVKLNLDTNIGDMTKPAFQLAANNSRGSADILHMEGRQKYTVQNVAYTICPIGNDDWMLKASQLEIDSARQVGVARNARVEFLGVPILYMPWMDFSLSDKRQSGFLGPVFGSTAKSGTEVTLPYYWNIAPNRDATIAPRAMAKRGLMLNNELRYMGTNYAGEAHVDILPNDALTNSTRLRTSLKHVQNLGYGFNASTNFNYVSDHAYFRDLSNTISSTSLTNLVREGVLSYGGGWWNAAARMQSYQTLQDPAAPVVEPYRRLPQITLGALRPVAGSNMAFTGEFVNFSHPTAVSGQRLVMYPSVSYPLIATPSFYVTPKFGVHYTHYSLGANNLGALPDTNRTLPIVSLDSGVVLERDWNLGGQNYVQTLEPRAYFLYIPYRNQNLVPNFDTAQADFNFAQMFTENRFFGSDRIGDAKQVTLSLTSRLLEANTGAERLRVAIGQRYSFKTPLVNLVAPEVATNNKSDILLAILGRITPKWSLNSAFQYNPNQAREEKLNVGARYQPESGKVLNLGYRFTRDSLRQVDISTQWPLSRRWSAMARWNYSLQDNRILELLTGLEYNESCWTARLVVQRFATATNELSTGIFAQLELNGLVRVGSDPLNALRQSIAGFTKLNQAPVVSSEQGLR